MNEAHGQPTGGAYPRVAGHADSPALTCGLKAPMQDDPTEKLGEDDPLASGIRSSIGCAPPTGKEVSAPALPARQGMQRCAGEYNVGVTPRRK